MDAFILLADSAVQHPDGTFSLLRGGIDRVFSQTEPIALRGSLVARVKASLSEAGEHAVSLRCTNYDGVAVMPPIQGGFVVPEQGGGMQIILNCSLALPRYGKYVFALLIDNQEMDTWTVNALHVEGKPDQAGTPPGTPGTPDTPGSPGTPPPPAS